MSILRLVGQLTLDSSGFKRALNDADVAAGKFGKRIAGYFSVAAIAAASKQVIEYASNIMDLSAAIGVSTTDLQKFEYAAKMSGASLEDVVAAFKNLSKNRAAALGGDVEKRGQFSAAGVDPMALRGQSITDTFRKVASVVKSTDFGAGQMNLLNDLMGKSAYVLIPAFQAGLAEAGNEAERLGIILGEKTIKSLDDAGDAMDRLTMRIRGAFAPMVGWLSEQLRGALDLTDISAGGMLEFMKAAFGGNFDDGANLKAGAAAFVKHMNEVLEARERLAVLEKKRPTSTGADEASEAAAKLAAEIASTKRILALREQIFEIIRRTEFRALDINQKILRVQQELARLQEKRANMPGGPMNMEEVLKVSKEMAEKEDELAELQAQKAQEKQDRAKLDFSPESQAGGLTPAFAARMAGLERIGARSVPNAEVQKRQLTVAEQQLTELRKIASKRANDGVFGN